MASSTSCEQQPQQFQLLKFEERLGAFALGLLVENAAVRQAVREFLDEAQCEVAPAPQLRTAAAIVSDEEARAKLVKTLGGTKDTLSVALAWLETVIHRLQQESADRAAYWLQFGTVDDAREEITNSGRYHRVVEKIRATRRTLPGG